MRALSLFSGIGGIDLAAEAAGIKTVAFCEREPFCQKVLRKHWPDVPIFDDVKTLRGGDVGTVDIIFGGWPCQPFSTAGKQRAFEDDRDLWPHFMRLVRECRAAWVVGENVDGFIRLGLDRTMYDLESAGYTCRAFNISAGAVGAAHKRFRTIVVAYANRYGLQGSKYTGSDGHISFSWVSIKHPAQLFTLAGGFARRDDLPTPRICRTSDGIPNRMDRLKALGNAVVPAQIYPIFKAIMEVERLG